ncbi:MAG: Fe(3+) ABC transporter substrate-binding protein [Cyanobacteriota bacterium]|nr:Fe(3+) ABC transporter substrate-binding protein [Cyanobacteriota bacterium]
MKLTRRSAIGFSLGVAMAIAAGCSAQNAQENPVTGSDNASSQGEGEVNLYSSRHYDADQQLYDTFTEETGIKVNLIEGKAEELIERIKSEGANSPADVLITVDVGNLWRAEQEGILQPVSSTVLAEKIPANLQDSEGKWFALTKRARVIVYNADNVQPEEISSYADLADPKWQDSVCMRSSSNIYNQSLVASKIEEMGTEKTEQWLEGLVANFARQPEGNDVGNIKAVASGECDISVVNTYYIARMKQSDDPADREAAEQVGVVFPDQDAGGTHVNISGAGVVETAPNQENAVAFLEYLTSPQAQEIFANNNNEYPAVTDVEANEFVKGLGTFKESPLQVEVYGEKNPDAVKLMDSAGWK